MELTTTAVEMECYASSERQALESESVSQTYQFCFYGDAIVASGADVGLLVYTPRFNAPEPEHPTQHLFCHAQCLRKSLHASVPVYALDLLGGCEESKPVSDGS